MSGPLRVLMVEDSEDDALLISRELRRAGYAPAFERVDTPDAMKAALERGQWDVVTSDSSMPRFSAPAALALLKQSGHDIPFIIVSGTIGEENAVALMKVGAHDYLLKTNLTRLAPAVEREVREAETRRQRRRAEEELRRQREALFQSEKLAAMGHLLAGLAHELNNPLSVVMGQATLLGRALGGGPEAVRADKIVKAVERCARIVRNFLALARQRAPERQRVALGQVVQESLELLAYSLRVEGIEIRLDLARDLPTLWADGHELQQLFINLITNAQHALRGVPAPRWITIKAHCKVGAERIVVEVTDNGPGIPPEVQGRIFDPFFTTKAPGEGTGLGLPLCRGIVEGHGGTLSVESELGRGALFRVELPIEDPQGAVESAAQVLPAPSPSGGRSILVVDDDAQVAEMLAEMLRNGGHQVEIAGDGIEALHKLEQASFDLIVSDLRMPRLDWPGLLREAERQHPGLAKRFVFTSGDVLAPGTLEFLESTQAPHLTKPFALHEVLRVVNQTPAVA